MILIYTNKTTKRLQYTFKFIFGQLLGVGYELTTDEDNFLNYNGSKINYSRKQFQSEIFFRATHLLFDSGIEGQELGIFTFDGDTAFYPVFDKKSLLPFDPFAATFFLLSRYEEYLPYIKDRFDRFDAHESVSFKNGFLQRPVINLWAEKIKKIIHSRYPEIIFKERKFTFTPTIDIDSAYAYLLKGAVRTTGGFLKSLSKLDFRGINDRINVLAGIRKDPYDTYILQYKLQKKYDLHPVYFILFAEYGEYDKNIPVNNAVFQQLIKSIGDYAEVGIHPSFNSNYSFRRQKMEVEQLSKVINREITKSRQHFLRLNFPSTYRNLINLDITDDYTMGYASETGFRAGVCDPFPFYDLDMEAETKLTVHPFQVMDGTLKDYQQLTPEQAIGKIRQTIDEVKAVKGNFISIWHNDSLGETGRWKGWQYIYEEMIRYALR